MITTILFCLGLVLLVGGAEALVKGASRLAAAMGISPLVIGLTVVAFGTSAPELAVSVRSSVIGQPDVALGNVLGSNICNVLLILGLSAAITPMVVEQRLVRIDVPLMIAVTAIVYGMAWDGAIGRVDGVILASCVVFYTAFAVVKSRREPRAVEREYEEALDLPERRPRAGRAAWNVMLVVGGLGFLVLGAHWLVEGAVAGARWLGVDELVIGLTVVAVGTSLPELATSVLASIRGERDIAVGNIVGSNLFNLLAVLGFSGAISPAGVAVSPAAFQFDFPVLLATTFACLPIFVTGHAIARWEGIFFLGGYIAYVTHLILAATGHAVLPGFRAAMAFFVLPLVACTLGVSLWRHVRSRPPHA